MEDFFEKMVSYHPKSRFIDWKAVIWANNSYRKDKIPCLQLLMIGFWVSHLSECEKHEPLLYL